MMADRAMVRFLAYTFILVFALLFSSPYRASAAGTAADAMCLPVWHYPWPCGKPWPPPPATPTTVGGTGCPCVDVTNGFSTPGICVAALKCSAQSSDGMPPMPPMPPMPMPKQPQQNQDPCTTGGTGGVVTEIDKVRSSTSSAASSTCPGGGGGFTPPVSGEINFSPFDFSNSGSSTISADLVSSLIGSAGTGAGAGSDATSPLGPDYSGGTNGPSEGLAGDIIIKGNAVTAILNNRDSAKKTELAAFYGLDSIQGEASTLIGALCKIRPWAINFLSTFASANVFDSICTFRGYKPPPPPPTPVKKAAAKAATKAATSTTSTPKVPAQADIWAVPASVISGGRTSIFWSAKGVDTCEETSSDKTFSRATLSGSSPTSPLTSAVTFTISCTSAAGAHVVNAVTVTVR